MDDILMKSVIEKVEAQENKIGEIQAALKKHSGNNLGIEDIKNAVESIREIAEGMYFPTQEMRELSGSVNECRKQLNQPAKTTVQHHHHFPKIIWLSIGLFIILAVVSTGWYMTGTTLKDYKANDTKYRFLKLNPNKSLMQLLLFTDSLYLANSNLRDSVIQKEEDIRALFDLEQKKESIEKEAEELKRKVNSK